MNSKKLMFLLLLILLILAGVLFYLFSNSNPKSIIFSEDNISREINNTANKEKDKKQESKKQEIKVISSKKQDEKNEITQKAKEPPTQTKPTNKQANLANSDLSKEYNELLAKSKRDTSLGEPRYNVYILDSAKLTKAQRKLVNEITTTFSIRGGYFVYEIFVQKISNENLRLYVFNKDLLNNNKWEKLNANALPNMLFKFNKANVLSIKNSFYMRDLKLSLGKNAKIKAMQISGYTDESGSRAYNYALGLKRSAAVASEFLRQLGKITLDSYGKDSLLSTNSYENRCASIVFM